MIAQGSSPGRLETSSSSSSAPASPQPQASMRSRPCRSTRFPDLSDVQVIVFTDYPGQAPQVVEDQVTYPLTTAMLTVPKSKVVRGFSFFGVSFVYVIFEDGTDIYWARSRVLEYLNAAANRNLPSGVTPTLGPDATGVGWVYQYAVVAKEAERWPNCASTAGLGGALRRFEGGRRRRGGERRRLRQAVFDRRRSGPDARAGCDAVRKSARRCATATWTPVGAPSKSPSSNSWCAAAAI
jgi:hypothetical protein